MNRRSLAMPFAVLSTLLFSSACDILIPVGSDSGAPLVVLRTGVGLQGVDPAHGSVVAELPESALDFMPFRFIHDDGANHLLTVSSGELVKISAIDLEVVETVSLNLRGAGVAPPVGPLSFDHALVTWAPDRRRLLFLGVRSPEGSYMVLTDLSGRGFIARAEQRTSHLRTATVPPGTAFPQGRILEIDHPWIYMRHPPTLEVVDSLHVGGLGGGIHRYADPGDGEHLLAEVGGRGLVKLRLTDGAVVAETPTPFTWNHAVFDSRGRVYLTNRKTLVTEQDGILRIFDRDLRPVREIDLAPDLGEWPSVEPIMGPDGDLFLVAGSGFGGTRVKLARLGRGAREARVVATFPDEIENASPVAVVRR